LMPDDVPTSAADPELPLHEDPVIQGRRWFLLAIMCLSLVMVVMSVSGLNVALPSLQRSLRLASGTVSLVFGIYLAHKIGFGDGLFTSDPHWTPQ